MSASLRNEPLQSASSTVSQTVVEKVAEAEGVAPSELDTRLYDVIDSDALNDLVASSDAKNATGGVVSFEFHGYEVTVRFDSVIELDPIQRE